MIDRARKTVATAAGIVAPSRRIWLLCECLASNPGHVISRGDIMAAVGMSESNYDGAVDSLVKRARKVDGLRPHIKTRIGMGYYWEENPIN